MKINGKPALPENPTATGHFKLFNGKSVPEDTPDIQSQRISH
jgi:hypothetical protein